MRKNESGQALVLVLLSLSVVLTLILYVLSRSVTDVAVSSRQEESVRAFSAAEAGVERALVIGTSNGNTIGDASYTANVSSFAEGSKSFSFPDSLSEGDTVTVWFMSHDAGGNLICDGTHSCFTGNSLQVCWGNSGTSAGNATAPAIEVSIYYETVPGDATTLKIARAAFDPNSGRTPSNSFSSADLTTCQISGNSYAFQKTVSFALLGIPAASFGSPGGLLFARVRMFYNSDIAQAAGTTVDFPGNSSLPSQGSSITSTGVAGGSNRRISVFQGWPEFPFASSSILSPAGITK